MCLEPNMTRKGWVSTKTQGYGGHLSLKAAKLCISSSSGPPLSMGTGISTLHLILMGKDNVIRVKNLKQTQLGLLGGDQKQENVSPT